MSDGESPVDAVAADAADTPAGSPADGATDTPDTTPDADADTAADAGDGVAPDAEPDEGGFSIQRRLKRAFLESDGKHPDTYSRDRIAKTFNNKLDELVGDGQAAKKARLGERVKIVGDRLLDRDLDEGFPGWLELAVGIGAWVWYLLTGAPDDDGDDQDADTVDVEGGVQDTPEGEAA